MAIRIKNLEALSKELEQKNHVYKDLHLDVRKTRSFDRVTEVNIPLNDIDVSFDRQAIYNSLRNLFTTRPGERFLFPRYGLDLTQYLFESVTPTIGEMIGNRIVETIKLYEPRVVLEKCLVTAEPDNNRYIIDLIIQIPVFNTNETINTVLDVKSESFVFLN